MVTETLTEEPELIMNFQSGQKKEIKTDKQTENSGILK